MATVKYDPINEHAIDNWKYKLVAWEDVDTAANSSTVKVSIYMGRNNSYSTYYMGNCNASITCNGETKNKGWSWVGSNGDGSDIPGYGWSSEPIYTATFTVPHEQDGSKTITVSGGHSSAEFSPSSGSSSGSITLTKIDRAPVVSALSTSSIARTSADASFTVTDQGATTVSASSIKASLTSGSYGSPVATITGTSSGASGTLSGLTPNTKYYIRGEATNTIGTTYTTESNFTTTGNVPTISSVTVSPSKNYATLAGSVTYDTNASFSSVEVQWGTSTSYGNTSNAWRIPASGSTLTQNTTYYYRVRVTDNWNRTSSWKTGSFITTGDNPSITNVTATPALNSCTLTPTVTYATNASFASVAISYGKTTSYGSTSTSYNLTSLDSKQTYYYSMTITDNFGRASTAYTGSFTTTSSAPTNVKISASQVKETSAQLALTASVGSPDWLTAASITITGTGYSTTKNLTVSGGAANPTPVTLTDLSPYTTYTVTGSATNSTGTTNATSITFTTLPSIPTISSVTIVSNGTTGIDISVTASGDSGSTLQYRFSSNGGTNWTSTQTGSTYSYTGLTAGSTYNVCLEVRNGDRFVYEYYTITLPTSGSTTTKGLIQYRQDGWWTNASKILITKYSKWLSK